MKVSGDDLLDGLIEFASIRELDVPRSLKSAEFAEQMSPAFWTLPRVSAAIESMKIAAGAQAAGGQISP